MMDNFIKQNWKETFCSLDFLIGLLKSEDTKNYFFKLARDLKSLLLIGLAKYID
jgi:hypothetical protein